MSVKIIVMGGSFNPPTIAHLKLMQSALDQFAACVPGECVRGVFVPSSDAYVSRKMGRLSGGADRTVLPEKLRFDMLQSFREKDQRLSVDGRELGTASVKGHTVETLLAIGRENPGAQVYFIFGGDKLEGLTRWNSYETLVSSFKVILFGRDSLEPERIMEANQALAAHADAFVLLRPPGGLDGISSSAVRERYRKGEPVVDLLTDEVWDMLKAYCGR